MTSIKVSTDDLELIWKEDHPDYETVDEDDWDDQGKYQYCYPVVKEIASGKSYTFCVQRSGSYFSDYDYNFPDNELTEVRKVKKVVETEVWEAV